jgi:hypothetical protein
MMGTRADAELDLVLRTAMAEALMAPSLEGRPLWVRVGVGGARFMAGHQATPASENRRVVCPTERDLRLPGSEREQRDAEARAQECFARAYAQTGNWRSVK